MGSAHFLVAAVDRIERVFTDYLAKRLLPGVRGELQKLRAAAEKALGPAAETIEIEDTQLLRRLISNGRLNAPWGLEIVNGQLWVGNFGDGKINVYDPNNGNFVGTPRDTFGIPLAFDGLWGMFLSNGNVFFTAGIADEEHGIFGAIF